MVNRKVGGGAGVWGGGGGGVGGGRRAKLPAGGDWGSGDKAPFDGGKRVWAPGAGRFLQFFYKNNAFYAYFGQNIILF